MDLAKLAETVREQAQQVSQRHTELAEERLRLDGMYKACVWFLEQLEKANDGPESSEATNGAE